jgi:predicted enzyme related to lactoylglutathione lyase
MAANIVHTEIPDDDVQRARAFWEPLFGWSFESFPGPFEYHMARVDDQSGVAITNMEPGKKGLRSYFNVEG